jgi:hypothetical protein
MTDWRDQILREFTPQVSRLTLVADPDGLLLEEGVLTGIHARGFELIPFEDHVAFRYAYESKFRSRWDRGESAELVVVLRSESSELEALPYDLLNAGRKLSFNLGQLFPNLSYPVVAALDRGDLDALYRAQAQYKPGRLGDNATKEFILRHVFEVARELVKQPSDLLRVLLRRYYGGQRVPLLLDEHFVHILRHQALFKDWPLEAIIPDRELFFAFLQERWPPFLDRLSAEGGRAADEGKPEYRLALPGPLDLPFGHDDIRVYVDDLFLEGLLHPVTHRRADTLSAKWVKVGIQLAPATTRLDRFNGLLQSLAASVPTSIARHEEWLHFAQRWAELVALWLEMGTRLPQPSQNLAKELRAQVDAAFLDWVQARYAGLHNQPASPPVMLHHIPRHLARQVSHSTIEKIALIGVDGLALDQWVTVPKVRAVGLVVDKVDRIMHGIELGSAGMHNQIRQWTAQGFLASLVDLLLDRGFAVYLTSDHGNVEARGCGRPVEGSVADLRGERVRVYPDAIFRRGVAAQFPGSIEWPALGLPNEYLPLIAPGRMAFVTRDKVTVAHGGICIDELIVPLVQVERKAA